MSDNKTYRAISDLVRSIMYASNDGNDNMLPEVEELGKLLGELDGVPYDAKTNRLVCMLKEFRAHNPESFKRLEKLNNDD